MKGEDLGKVFAETLSSLLVIGIGAQLIRPPSIMVEHINSASNFLKSIVNKIIEELSKEGIYLPLMEPISLPTSPDIASLANGLRETLNRINMAIGILKGLIDASKEDC
jgi:ABC-type cobalt transport system substrate-binding protein